MPSIMTMDESAASLQSTARARQHLPFVSELSAINISSIISLYNGSFAGVDIHGAKRALVEVSRRVLPEDVLR